MIFLHGKKPNDKDLRAFASPRLTHCDRQVRESRNGKPQFRFNIDTFLQPLRAFQLFFNNSDFFGFLRASFKVLENLNRAEMLLSSRICC